MGNELLQGMIGLCQRAGKLESGTSLAEAAIRSGRCCLALVDSSASANTVKRMNDSCSFYGVSLIKLPPGLLEKACGKSNRMAAAVTDAGFAEKMMSFVRDTTDGETVSLKKQHKKSGGAGV